MFHDDYLLMILMVLIVIIYALMFYKIIIRRSNREEQLKTMYAAICTIFENDKKLSVEEIICDNDFSRDKKYDLMNEIKTNYDIVCQEIPGDYFSGILDMLEYIIFSHNAFSDRKFRNIYSQDKNENINRQISDLVKFIKSEEPFISLSSKDNELLNNIKISIENSNRVLGIKSLEQLSNEINEKNKLIKKKERNSKTSNIISIVGVILTFFFGILSFTQMFF